MSDLRTELSELLESNYRWSEDNWGELADLITERFELARRYEPAGVVFRGSGVDVIRALDRVDLNTVVFSTLMGNDDLMYGSELGPPEILDIQDKIVDAVLDAGFGRKAL